MSSFLCQIWAVTSQYWINGEWRKTNSHKILHEKLPRLHEKNKKCNNCRNYRMYRIIKIIFGHHQSSSFFGHNLWIKLKKHVHTHSLNFQNFLIRFLNCIHLNCNHCVYFSIRLSFYLGMMCFKFSFSSFSLSNYRIVGPLEQPIREPKNPYKSNSTVFIILITNT